MGRNHVMNKRKWYWVGGIIVVLLIVLFVGHVKKTGGITAPKEVSFGKTSGERIWYGTEKGKGKDALIDYVYVTKGKKMIQYQIFNDDITLGKVSKMSNNDVIKLAKKQDRKYFDKSIDEVKALRDGKSQIGLQDDMMDDDDLKADLKWGPLFYFLVDDNGRSTHRWENPEWATKEQYEQAGRSTDGKYHQKFTENQMITHLISGVSEDDYLRSDDLAKMVRTRRLNALIDNMKNVKYLAPKWQTIGVKNYTDDTGNKVQSKKITFKSIDEFNDAGTIDKNAQTISENKKQELVKIVGGDQSDASTQLNACDKAFDSSYEHHVTKNIFKPHTFDNYFTIFEPLSQTIHDSRFIGYAQGDDCYLLTKAQNDNQKAVLSK